MVYRVTYALIVEEYIATYKKLNCYKVKLVIWVENIELEIGQHLNLVRSGQE